MTINAVIMVKFAPFNKQVLSQQRKKSFSGLFVHTFYFNYQLLPILVNLFIYFYHFLKLLRINVAL